ncbi:malonyl-CoA decarboxylase [Ahrensia sp. 13_GOM-1096m]|uniref:malonyl-CoA decarboxylase n=1 Tax=Ahrensia sp. 13_GOM-1096m TaxID=1380380 RepID=UPI00047D4D52|nr:malonyl-CoA decarboxylase [Ahrensia sp. 13_GOM-1096m]
MTLLSDLLAGIFERRPLPGAIRRFASEQDIEDLCRDLLGSHGEISGSSMACRILDLYDDMDDAGKREFFEFLADDMDIDTDGLSTALEAYRATNDKASYNSLMEKAEPLRQELARRLNQVPSGTARLVDMRADLLRFVKEGASFGRVDSDFRHLFQSWFNRGFLVMRPISWRSPAHILEKIIAYEAVHAIESWDDLRSRLQPEDRRCFGFFHPAMPDEPLIFVEVALTKGIAQSIPTLLDANHEPIEAASADTAVFYSISNCQKGLAGISFGNSLIKQVVEELSRTLPQLKTFVTLSPIPNLRRYAKENDCEAQLDDDEKRAQLAAHYLLTAKANNGHAMDPVARFHLNNGALVHDIHANGDPSLKGQEQSGGAMVNYLYDLKKIAENHEAYATQQSVVATPRAQQLARQFTSTASIEKENS